MFLPSPPSPFTTLVGTVYRLFRENRLHGNTRNHRQRVDLEVYAQLISIIVLKIEKMSDCEKTIEIFSFDTTAFEGMVI